MAVGDLTNAPTQHLPAEGTEPADKLLESLREATLGEYEVLTELGRGGMAVVYLGHDLSLGRRVAIKVMSPELRLMGEEVVERFKREARTAAQLSHPAIIPIYAVKDVHQHLYFVMKFIKGRSLEYVIREEGRLPPAVTQNILTQVASALEYAHRHQVIHRDIKPGNIMLDEDGWAVVTDFGIAKALAAEGLTMTGAALGTPTYMSPEQCAGIELTGAADQYSLGVVAYEMLSGKLPFDGDSAMTVMYKHTHEPPPPIGDVWPDCPAELGQAVMRMLEKEPENRWPSVEHATEAIAAAAPASDSEIRLQLTSMIKRASNQSLLAQFETPRTPVTAGRSRSARATPGQITPDTPALVGGPGGAGTARRWSRTWLVAVPTIGAAAVAGWFLRPAGDPVGLAEPAEPPVAAQPAVATFDVAPGALALTAGDERQLAARPRDSAGTDLTGSLDVQWTSSDGAVARVTTDGVVTAVASGVAQITARIAGHSATVGVTVTAPVAARPPTVTPQPARVASVTVTASTQSVSVGDRVQLRVVAEDAQGTPISDRPVTWRTDDSGIAIVSSSGLVTAMAEGTTQITATGAGLSAVTRLTVTPVAVASVRISPDQRTIRPGETVQLTAVPLARDGAELRGRPIAWSASGDVVRVSPTGLVTGVAPGLATVTASSEAQSGRATISVAPLDRPEAPPPDPARDRADIETALSAYAQAIESRDLDQLRRAYPGLTQPQEDAWRTFFQNVQDLTVTFTIDAVNIAGDTARAQIGAVQQFRTNRRQSQDFTFRATLEREPGGWRITQIQD